MEDRTLRRTPINEAEAILEPYWDGGSSEHPGDKLSLLDNYDVTVPDGIIGSVEQIWCAVRVQFQKGPVGSVISMRRNCEADISGYDVIRVFASIPSWVSLTVRATIDGSEVVVIDGQRGKDTNDEHDGRISGATLETVTLEYRLLEPRPANVQLLWLGLSNGRRQAQMEARPSPYGAEWPGMLYEPDDAEVAAEGYRPALGIFFDAEDLGALRRSVQTGSTRERYAALLESVRGNLSWEPEKDIGKYVMRPDRRWVRNRDMERRATAGVMEELAFVGLIEEDYELLRMAARMALSAAHCELWSESIIGTMPGTTWHHRSFTEEIYCRACGLVLDWAGSILTPHAKQIIRDAIIMKGLPRIESDFKRMEYIRHMNQGIVFSSGRIIGALSLLDAHPRYESLVEEAERDLHEMVESYVHSDGGTLEGMSYWAYTFSNLMPVVYALARHRNVGLAEYATETLRRTGDYGLGMLSTVGAGATYLPVNDAHADRTYPPVLAAAYSLLSGKPQWRALYAESVKAAAGPRATAAPDIYSLIMAGADGSDDEASTSVSESASLAAPRTAVFPDVGQLSWIRRTEDGALTHVHLCSGPTYGGHYHEDKGAIIVEAGGDPLIYDRGVTDYHHPETNLIGMASRHNLIYPEAPDGRFMEQPNDAEGGTLTSWLEDGEVRAACSDNRAAWADGVFDGNLRRLFSPAADLLIIDDELELRDEMVVSFRLNTPFPTSTPNVDPADGAAAVTISGASFAADIFPLSRRPAEITAAVEGVDSHLEPATLVRLATTAARRHRLVTAVIIRPVGEKARWRLDPSAADDSGGVRLATGDQTVSVDAGTAGVLRIMTTVDGVKRTYECSGGQWSQRT